MKTFILALSLLVMPFAHAAKPAANFTLDTNAYLAGEVTPKNFLRTILFTPGKHRVKMATILSEVENSNFPTQHKLEKLRELAAEVERVAKARAGTEAAAGVSAAIVGGSAVIAAIMIMDSTSGYSGGDHITASFNFVINGIAGLFKIFLVGSMGAASAGGVSEFYKGYWNLEPELVEDIHAGCEAILKNQQLELSF